MAYCFDLLGNAHSAPFFHALFSRFLSIVGSGWPCWALSNHDCVRVATRWGGDKPDTRLLQLAAALQLSLRGSPCIYQGDELGLTEAHIAFEDLQDPFGITMWPTFKGRDGCRTPMPWSAGEPNAGFGPTTPWLPVEANHLPLAVDQQVGNPASMLNFYTRLLQWRRQHAALMKGDMVMLPVHDQVLAFTREHQGEKVLCVFNFSPDAVQWALPTSMHAVQPVQHSPLEGGTVVDHHVALQPWGGLFATL